MKKLSWDGIKTALRKSFGSEKEEDDENLAEKTGGDSTNEDDGEEFEDAAPLVKALTDKIESLEGTIAGLAKATEAIVDKLGASEAMQKSIGQGILALVEHADSSPSPRKGAVTPLEAKVAAMMSKSMGGGSGTDGGGSATGSLKPFTPERMDRAKDILVKAVSDGEIDLHTCGKWETHMNKSVGRAVYAFPEDFVAFMKKKLSA